MLKDQLAKIKREGFRTILQVFKNNPAKRLYDHFVFSVYGETETHYQIELI